MAQGEKAARGSRKAAKKKATTERKPIAKPCTPKNAASTAPSTKRDRRIELFAAEYIVDFNGKLAAMRAGYGASNARFEASRLLAMPEVQAKVDEAMEARLKRAALTGDQVLARIRAIATADANSLIELRRTCCRHCYGTDHRYQRTQQELRNYRSEFEAKIDKQCDDPIRAAALKEEFNAEGGIGWDPRKEPLDDCPECFGQGAIEPFAKDTRDLSPEARLLYRGVKVNQNGTIQVLTADQDGMLRMLAEHAGLLRRKVEVTGKDGGPVEQRHTTIGGILDDLASTGADTGPGPASG